MPSTQPGQHHRSRVAVTTAIALLIASIGYWQASTCRPVIDDDLSVARVWNEVALDAIRRDFPSPTVHARNLFHLSAAMWDSWSAFEQGAKPVFVETKFVSIDGVADQITAISFAAYEVLSFRYRYSAGAGETLAALDSTLVSLCLDPLDPNRNDPTTAVGLGSMIGRTVITENLDDGSNELRQYSNPGYKAVNEPLVVSQPGIVVSDPNHWQPLSLSEQITQNGQRIAGAVQIYIGSHWGHVEPFGLTPAANGLPIDPGTPPTFAKGSGSGFVDAAVDVLRHGAVLEPVGDLIDISPGSFGNNPLGSNQGRGHPINPVTGESYAPNVVDGGDFSRVLAEFWADGPKSETPPGHWNTIANEVSDQLESHRIGGTGPALDRLEWDVKLYLALNGALHDSAIAAWGAKAYYDTSRPITMIRFLASLGQASDPSDPSYSEDGLPLIPGLIELITPATTAPGQKHHDLSGLEGELAVWAWNGQPQDPKTDLGGVGWIRAAAWLPYQKSTFVTPAFAAYVSGHSTFSRAAAEVLTAITGDAFFPGGIAEFVSQPGDLEFESGPSHTVALQWATYFDAADQAGLSRIYGGIHIGADDLAGRRLGADCGKTAWIRALTLFGD